MSDPMENRSLLPQEETKTEMAASQTKPSRRQASIWALFCVIVLGFLVRGWLPDNILDIFTFKCFSHHTTTSSTSADDGLYLLGVGKADITGPVVEVNMMGYADPKQLGTGLRQRLYSRAFIIGSVSRPEDRVVYLVLDSQSGDTAVRYGILEGLSALGGDYASLYGHANIAVTGTHSHSGPGAWLNYLLPQITSKGFDQQSYRAIVDGAVLSVVRAHESLAPGRLSLAATKVTGAGINRSLFAYLANPADERAAYDAGPDDDGSVDTTLTLLKFRRAADGKDMGVLTWYPTHGTSLYGNNTLISGDNKGVAAYLFERAVSPDFVAGFSQSSVGDVSPNVLGAWCEDGSGSPCSFENSTCPSDGRSQHCHARGPLFAADDTGTASCFEIGRRQFEPAKALFDELVAADAAGRGDEAAVRGGLVRSFHAFHNMSGFTFSLPNGTIARTCPAALGYSFAAGTSDGPGKFNFAQNDSGQGPSDSSPVWKLVRHFLKEPSEVQKACHAPKPILIDAGELTKPYMWTPNVVDVQVFRVGQLVVIVSPGEASTMAGRRWMAAVKGGVAALAAAEGGEDTAAAGSDPVVVLGGPANSYTHYITTEEEYAVQRYEGASTLYGPHTLAAYINLTLAHLPSLSAASSSPQTGAPKPGPFPPDNSNRSLCFIPSVVRDAPPPFRHFGDAVHDVKQAYFLRGEPDPAKQPRAVFVAANPRNDLRLERTYAAVERLRAADGGGGGGAEEAWDTARTDADWNLVFRWRRTSEILATSQAEVHWEVEPWAEPGTYRLRYFGNAKAMNGNISEFNGTSSKFEVV